jgi:hypothetical protein
MSILYVFKNEVAGVHLRMFLIHKMSFILAQFQPSEKNNFEP